MTELHFRGALGPQPGGAVDLVFGGTASPPVDPPGPVIRPGLIRTSTGMPWRAAAPAAPQVVAVPWRAAAGIRAEAELPWQGATGLTAPTAIAWGVAAALRHATVAPWATSRAAAAAVQLPWRGTTALASANALPWRAGAALAALTSLPWRAARPDPLHIRAPWSPAMPIRVLASASARSGQRSAAVVRAPWRAGVPVLSIGGPWAPVPVTPPLPVPCYLPDPGNDVLLLLRESVPGAARLLFACRRAALVVVPIRRVYFVVNDVSLQLLDGTPIPQTGLSLSLDVDSWCWRFAATLPGSAMSLLNPDAGLQGLELLASINGQIWRLVAEPMGRDRMLGRSTIRLQGRGRTALLAAPYAAVATFNNLAGPLTSQQLIDQALPSGWTCDYGQQPWLVPAGAWSHRGTPLTAAMAVATAAGGYLQPHANAPVLRVLPRYPAAPWQWATLSPDIDLPSALTRREGIEWASKPAYNRVYVAGAAVGGKLVRVTRAGTAGDLAADTVTEALVTHVDAGRQRGLAILGDTGAQAMVSLSLQVLPETGVITPGKLVRYTDGGVVRLGLVRSVSVESGFPGVWQTIGLETHVG